MLTQHKSGWPGVNSVAFLAVTWLILGSLASFAHAQSNQPSHLNRLIATLAADRLAFGAQNDVPADGTGLDWLFIDMEHSPYLLDRLEAKLGGLAASAAPTITPIARIPLEGHEPFKWAIKQVLDAGVMGVVVPRIENREQALAVVRAMRYPPQKGGAHPEPAGARGYGPGRAAKLWGVEVREYLRRADLWPLNPSGDLLAVMLIETVEGVKNIDEILGVPGVGMVFIGPGDLGMSLGVGPGPSAEKDEAIAAVGTACRSRRAVCGLLITGGESEFKIRVAQGFRVFLGTTARTR